MKQRLILVCLCLVSFKLYAEPQLDVLSPIQNQVFIKNKVLFKGKTTDLSSLTLNGRPITLNANGRFYVKEDLTVPNTYHEFTLIGKTTQNVTVKHALQVYYKVPDAPPYPVALTLYPKHMTTLNAEHIQISGHIKGGNRLRINNTLIPLNADGTFRTGLHLKAPTQNISITVYKDAARILRETRTYYLAPPKDPLPSPKTAPPSLPTYTFKDLMEESVTKVSELYENMGWKTEPLSQSQQLDLGHYSHCLHTQNQYLIVLPLENKEVDIYAKSQTVASDFQDLIETTIQTISILWINQNHDILELHFDANAHKLTPFLVLLNDKELPLSQLSKAHQAQLLRFSQNPFGG